MSPHLIGIIGFIALMVLVFNKVPIAISMILVSGVGFLALHNWNPAVLIAQFGNTFFNASANYEFAVLPLFILLGMLAGLTGIAEKAFDAINTWIGRVKGGTLFTVIIANGIYGACASNSQAGSIIFSRLAMPSLRKQGYNETLSLGVLCSSGSLASLIPPSQSILTICLVAPICTYGGRSVGLSLGTGLMAGVLPGVVLILVLCLFVRFYGFVRKGSVPNPPKEKTPVSEKLKSLKLLIPILCLFVLMIGGASLGWFSSTVAGAIGATVVTIYAIACKASLKKIWDCFFDSCLMQASIFFIIVAGGSFSKFIAASGLTTFLGNLVQQMQAPRIVIFAVVMVFFLIGGAVMNIMPLLICTCNIVFAVLVDGCGFHPYVVLVCLVLMVEVAQLTPPIGLGTYIVANALRMDPMKIFKAVAPFFVVLFLYAFILALVPDIVTALPRLMGILSF